MRLYVVGSASPDPANWSRETDGFALVLAGSADDARAMAEEENDCPVCEVSTVAPMMLVSMLGNDVMGDMTD